MAAGLVVAGQVFGLGPIGVVDLHLDPAGWQVGRGDRIEESLPSRIGAWASAQSRPLASRAALMLEVARVTATRGIDPPRPPHWGGFRIHPVEIEFWADGAHRLHDRFRWTRPVPGSPWEITRLSP